MDVRLVVPELGPQTGGIGRYVAQLQAALRAHGVQADLARFRYLPGAQRRAVLKALPTGLEGAPANVTHLTRIMGASMLLFRRLPRTVVTVHDLGGVLCSDDRREASTISRLLLRLSLRGMRRADRIIAVSEFTRRDLVRTLAYSQSRVDAIPHGVDMSVFRPVPGARRMLAERFGLSLPADTRLLLYVGSEAPRKDLPTLARAVARLKQDGHRVHWLKAGMAGLPAYRARLLTLLDNLGIRRDITFLDTADDTDLAVLYSAADVYCQSSVWEGFGLPVLEAMACGAPVVSTSAASLPEIVGDAGILVLPRDPEALATATARVLANTELCQNLSEHGRRRAAEFTWQCAASGTVTAYERAAATRDRQVTGSYHDQLV